ncbi:MAG: D-aminoacylase [Candidatus Bathyarchaeia archaeon]
MDLVIRGGTIVDGAGTPRFRADIAVNNGRISKVGSVEQPGDDTLVAEGRVVTPGFIDIHTHSDFPLLQNRKAESSVRQGVTTAIIGACGRSCAPVNDNTKEFLLKDIIGYDSRLPVTWHSFAEYLSEFEKPGIAQNVAALAAHNAVRIVVMGYDARKPSGSEMEEMKGLVRDCMVSGAIGLSTGLAYPPGSNADTQEIIELARVAREYEGIYSSHLRGTDGDFIAGVREAIEIGKAAKIPVHMGHFCGFFGDFEETLLGIQLIEEARHNGCDVTCDLYPYLAGANPLTAFLPPSIFNRNWADLVQEIRNPATRKKLAEEIRCSETGSFWFTRQETLDRIRVFDLVGSENSVFKGKTLSEIAAMKEVDPIESILELLADEGKAMYNLGVICEWMGEKDNFAIFRKPYHMVGSDGIALAPYGDLASFKFHPRAYGTYPRVIAKYVREKAIFDLEEAVRKMTSMPASRAGIMDRGEIRKGMWADLVIFDYDRVTDTSTYEDPAIYPEGIEYVIVNGQIVVEKGQHTGRLPGKVLRHRPSGRMQSSN